MSVVLPDKTIAEVLSTAAPLDTEVNGGRLTLEERHPFLCLHRGIRNKEDPGTAELIMGQACFAIAPSGNPADECFASAVETTLTHLAGIFRKVLLLEVWALDPPELASEDPQVLRIGLTVPKSPSPDAFVETMDRALSAESWPGGSPEIDIERVVAPHPLHLKPVLPRKTCNSLGIVYVSLGVAPAYRDPITDNILPFQHRMIRTALGRVLKKALYTFCHSEGVHLPAHYHELGRTQLSREVLKIDEDLSAVAAAFDPLLLVTPVNSDAAWNAFQSGHCKTAPKFFYRPVPIDPPSLKRKLYSVPMDRIEDPTLHRFFDSKRVELDRFLNLLEDRETDRFVLSCQQIFGAPDDELVSLAEKILKRVKSHTPDDKASASLGAEEVAVAARADLSAYGFKPEDVEIRDDVPGLMVSRGRFLIGRHARVAERRLRATLDHEIGVHVVTYRNGVHQTFTQLRVGMAGYEDLQEGLAVFAEHCTGGLSRPRLRQIAGRVLAVKSVLDGDSFLNTFKVLHDEHEFNMRTAFFMAMRSHRGGGFTKDIVYLRGLRFVIGHLLEGHDIVPLLAGKVSHDHLDVIEELTHRGLIRSPKVVSTVFTPERLESVVAGLKAHDGLIDVIAGGV